MIQLIKSVSGIRGIYESKPTDTLTKTLVENTIIAFTNLISSDNTIKDKYIIIGRDGRKSGEAISKLIIDILKKCGFNIINTNFSTTPTIAHATSKNSIIGGIMVTASHNPLEWNGIKLFKNGRGLDKNEWQFIFDSDTSEIKYKNKDIGVCTNDDTTYLNDHINAICTNHLIAKIDFKNSKLKIAVDGCNSSGSRAMKLLLNKLGIFDVLEINYEINGSFNRPPEPKSSNLTQLIDFVKNNKCDIGFALDPDGDRLSVVDENGVPWGEEYTLISAADYVLNNKPKSTVSNLSSSQGLQYITSKYNQKYYSSPVGESNVLQKIIDTNSIIGGEGNGGVIFPEINKSRDGLVAVALILSNMIEKKCKASQLKKSFPQYVFYSEKVKLHKKSNLEGIFQFLYIKFKKNVDSRIDGLKINYKHGWIHVRRSNTEPIVRICSEADSVRNLAKLKSQISKIQSIFLSDYYVSA